MKTAGVKRALSLSGFQRWFTSGPFLGNSPFNAPAYLPVVNVHWG